jgi:outer membrane protein assembly factor BamB
MSRIDSAYISESFITNKIALFGNKIAVTKKDGGPHNALIVRDALTGRQLWTYSDYVDIPEGLGIDGVEYMDGRLIVNTLHEINVIDTVSGSKIWRYDHQEAAGWNGFPRMKCTNGMIYHERHLNHNNQSYEPVEAELVRTPVTAPAWETIINFKRGADFQSPSVEMPGFWLKPGGDTLVIFQNRQVQFAPPNRNKTDIYAVNSRTKAVEWKVEDIQQCNCTSNVTPPLIWQNKVYFHGFLTVYCMDAATGNILWKKEMAHPVLDQVIVGNMVLEEDIYVIRTHSGNTYGVNPITGHQLWQSSEDWLGGSLNMEYHNGIIYTTGGDFLYAFDIKNGKLLAKVRSPHWDGFGKVSIHHQLGLLYVNGFYFTYCYQLLR